MENSVLNYYNQGVHYYYGSDGYPLNKVKALDFFQKAAQMGNSDAMNYIGLMYENGEALPVNYGRAVEWFYSAIKASNENGIAAFNLGRMYYWGRGVQKDVALAFEFLDAAKTLLINQKNSSAYSKACHLIGIIYMTEYKKNVEAFPYFMEAANHGNIVEAWHNLGYLTFNGVGNAGSQAERMGMAYSYYEKAAKQGYAPSMCACGGICLNADMQNEARDWYTKALEKGYEPAKKELKRLKFIQGGSLLDLF